MIKLEIKKTYNKVSTSIIDVANYIVKTYGATSLIRLQKLCYICQGIYLAAYNEPMFDEDFKVWVNGVSCEELVHMLQPNIGIITTEDIECSSDCFGKEYAVKEDIDDKRKHVVDDVVNVFYDNSSEELSFFTSTQLPFLITPKKQIIEKTNIAKYYKKLLTSSE